VNCKRGEVWLVNLDPTIGHEIKKSRPALVIQNDVGNEFSPITIIAPITSQGFEKVYPIEVPINLKKKSKILLNQIRAVDKRRLLKRMTKLDSMQEVDEALKISLGLL